MELNFKGRTWVMGILNMTPDSFSDGGSYMDVELALAHAKQMVADGADIIDVGGESTRPGHTTITVEEELDRVIPIVHVLSRELDVPISIDTYKSTVAEGALKAGAHIINDIWGAKRDPRIAKVAAEYKVPLILMHNREEPVYRNFWEDVKADIEGSLRIAKEAGVTKEQIILDPGIGFGKTHAQNIEMMQRLDQFAALGYPVLLGTSRKSLIGNVLGLPVKERLEGSLATVCFGIQKGCDIVRVHDVKETARTVRMMDALTGKWLNAGEQ